MKKIVFVVVVAMLTLIASGVMAQLTLPYVGSATSSGTAFYIGQNGTGHNGVFQIGNNASSSTAITGVTTGLGIGVHGKTYGGYAGVKGETVKINGIGVYGQSGSGALSMGVYGYSTAGRGVVGVTQTGEAGVKGGTNKTNGVAVMGVANTGTSAIGVLGSSTTGVGVKGETTSTQSYATAVLGLVSPTAAGAMSAGVKGQNNGTSTNGIGVYGSHGGGGWGVFGQAPSGIGVFGNSTSGTGVYGQSSGGYAILADGKLGATGQIVKRYADATYNQAVPIAYGTVTSEGTLRSGTANVTVTLNATYPRYEITIADETYHYYYYTTNVTAIGATPLIATCTSVSGQLLVYLNDLSGNKVQGNFCFTVYKSAAN